MPPFRQSAEALLPSSTRLPSHHPCPSARPACSVYELLRILAATRYGTACRGKGLDGGWWARFVACLRGELAAIISRQVRARFPLPYLFYFGLLPNRILWSTLHGHLGPYQTSFAPFMCVPYRPSPSPSVYVLSSARDRRGMCGGACCAAYFRPRGKPLGWGRVWLPGELGCGSAVVEPPLYRLLKR